jgi:hypothetical protein
MHLRARSLVLNRGRFLRLASIAGVVGLVFIGRRRVDGPLEA